MRTLTLIICLLLPSLGEAQELTLPPTVKGTPGNFCAIRAETDCRIVRWVLLDEGASLVPPELLKDSRTALILTPRAGRYRLLAYTAMGDTPSVPVICLLEIAAPSPPTPPTPPTPPPPTDPLAIQLQAAYSADPGAPDAKATQLAILYGVYAAMTEHCKTDTTLKSLGDVLAATHRTAKDMKMLPLVLIEVRKLIAADVATLGSSPGAPFDATLRASTVITFGRIAKALEIIR